MGPFGARAGLRAFCRSRALILVNGQDTLVVENICRLLLTRYSAMEPIEAELARLVERRLRFKPDASTDLTVHGIDSLEMANLIQELEDRFHIEIDQDIFEVTTFGELSDYVLARLPKNSRYR